jgi:hypothetical protein
MVCTNLQNYSAVRFLKTRGFLFCSFQVVKWILGELLHSVIFIALLLNILTFHTTAKIRVTSSTPLHTWTKCLPRQLSVCICNLPFSSSIFSVNLFALVHPWYVLHVDILRHKVLLNKLLSQQDSRISSVFRDIRNQIDFRYIDDTAHITLVYVSTGIIQNS